MNDIAREPVLGGAPAPAVPQPLRVRFCGSGSEYFRIWIVNLLLTIVTLGIYSAWAKVRTLQYFYRNTQLGGRASTTTAARPPFSRAGRSSLCWRWRSTCRARCRRC